MTAGDLPGRCLPVVMAMALLAAGCSGPDGDDPGGAASSAASSAATSPAGSTDSLPDGSTTTRVVTTTPTTAAEPRLDPLPAGASYADVDDVLISMLGPTTDVAGQARRVEPGFPELPGPPDAEVIEASFGTVGFDPGMPPFVTALIAYRTGESVEAVTELLRSAGQQAGWAEVPGRPAVAAVQLGFDLPDLDQPQGSADPDLGITIDPDAGGGSRIRLTLQMTAGDADRSWARFSGWQPELPVPSGATIGHANTRVLLQDRSVVNRATYLVTEGPWLEYRARYGEYLGQQGFTADQPVSEAIQGDELTLTGPTPSTSVVLKPCCTDYGRGGTASTLEFVVTTSF